ncbi:MAG: hypothetical protein R3321_09920, partial [Nitrososphaeraceae archaeon]|nr:hypothetical protein [Nitrososphaeraceae archaeon]
MIQKNYFLHLCTTYLILFFFSTPLSAQDNNMVNKIEIAGVYFNDDTLLIKNANLIGWIDDLKVNLVIIEGKLTVVTKDDVWLGSTTPAFDAENGFLMGKLVIGAAPSFIILSDNPRENFEVILNSAKYVKFAMNYGQIILNKLPVIKDTQLISDIESSTWTSYNPPPIAVPISYYDSRKWNKFDTDNISGLFNGVVALDRKRWVTQDSASNSQVGNLSSSSIGEIRGLRFGLVGTINFDKPWFYTIFFATEAFDKGYNPETESGIILYDARIDIPLPRFLTLSIGKQKEPISLERLTLLLFLPNQERSAVND